ncbi:phosphotransferase, partial [Acinetobacter baumannii]|nr:phosphotransferase [Acinetobacter baumannii]
MNTQREQLIHTWLTSVLENDQFQIAYLAGDASFRRYARIQLQNKTYMLMDAP